MEYPPHRQPHKPSFIEKTAQDLHHFLDTVFPKDKSKVTQEQQTIGYAIAIVGIAASALTSAAVIDSLSRQGFFDTQKAAEVGVVPVGGGPLKSVDGPADNGDNGGSVPLETATALPTKAATRAATATAIPSATVAPTETRMPTATYDVLTNTIKLSTATSQPTETAAPKIDWVNVISESGKQKDSGDGMHLTVLSHDISLIKGQEIKINNVQFKSSAAQAFLFVNGGNGNSAINFTPDGKIIIYGTDGNTAVASFDFPPGSQITSDSEGKVLTIDDGKGKKDKVDLTALAAEKKDAALAKGLFPDNVVKAVNLAVIGQADSDYAIKISQVKPPIPPTQVPQSTNIAKNTVVVGSTKQPTIDVIPTQKPEGAFVRSLLQNGYMGYLISTEQLRTLQTLYAAFPQDKTGGNGNTVTGTCYGAGYAPRPCGLSYGAVLHKVSSELDTNGNVIAYMVAADLQGSQRQGGKFQGQYLQFRVPAANVSTDPNKVY